MSDAEKGYAIQRNDRGLVFRTTSFSAERGSVLHSGIYNREFASALAAFGAAGLVYLAIGLRYGKTLLVHAVVFAVFVSGFLLLRRLVFKERSLSAEFDRSAGLVRLRVTGLARVREDVVPLRLVQRLRIDRKEIGVENPDGTDLVRRISAQHGTVIPGFGEEQVFFVVRLVLTDGTARDLHAARKEAEALEVYEELRGVLV